MLTPQNMADTLCEQSLRSYVAFFHVKFTSCMVVATSEIYIFFLHLIAWGKLSKYNIVILGERIRRVFEGWMGHFRDIHGSSNSDNWVCYICFRIFGRFFVVDLNLWLYTLCLLNHDIMSSFDDCYLNILLFL